jgi:arylsulfatase A-like enzyme
MLRRQFLGSLAGAAAASAQSREARPNILWITCEDMSPNLGCYGDTYATSPNIDRLATRSLRYRNVWSNAPVCAPARTTIISGMYPPSTGSEHMRSFVSLPEGARMYPCHLRDAGYYCSNNVKEDYNVDYTGKVWDDSSNKAHWRNRAANQPFFSIFNFVITHESQIRTRPHTWVHDPAKVRLPAYHPDTPEVRKDWAQYYDNITTMDGMAGKMLQQLEQDGLVDDTIVFFYSDHGSGMPRSKRFPYNSGLHVPLLVHIPDKFRHLAPKDYKPGGTTDRLVSFVDLAPTLFSLTGIPKPAHCQGHAFLGANAAPEQPYVYGFRGRMDERYDLMRSVRDQRYVYIRNYMPHRIYGQHVAYMFETPTTSTWHRLYQEGKLTAAQKHFWETKPPEELYDLQNDRDEVNNLAADPAHRKTLERFRAANSAHLNRIRDLGFLPESLDRKSRPMEKVIAAADTATNRPKPGQLTALLKDPDDAVRYWGATGYLVLGRKAPLIALEDPAPAVRVPAAESIARYGTEAEAAKALDVLLDLADMSKHGPYLAMQALTGLDYAGDRVKPYRDRIAQLPRRHAQLHQRVQQNPGNLIDHITGARTKIQP